MRSCTGGLCPRKQIGRGDWHRACPKGRVWCVHVAHEVKLLAAKAYPGDLVAVVQDLIDIVIERYLLGSVRIYWYIIQNNGIP
jgi:hypothetical protein